MPLGGGEPQRLTELKEDLGEPAWSPDGTQIAFSARVRDEAYEEEDEKKRAPRRFKRLRFKLDSVGWTGDRRTPPLRRPGRRLRRGEADHRRRLRGRRARPGRRTGRASRSRSARERVLGHRADRRHLPRPGRGRRARAADTRRQQPLLAELLADGTLLACKWSPGGFDFPRHTQIAVVDAATGGNRRILTASLDRQCAPYPELREPLWDDDAIVFAIEDAGNIHVYRVSPDGGEPELVHGGEIVLSGYDARDGLLARTGTTAPNLSELYVGEKQLTSVGKGFRGGPGARRAGALHRGLEGRHRGRRLDRPPRRPRGREALPGARSTSTAAPSPSTAPASSTSSRSTRAAVTRSSTRIRAARPGTPRSGAARSWGRASSAPAGARSTTRTCWRSIGRRAGAVRLLRPGAGRRDGRLLRRLHDLVDRRPHEPLPGGLLRAGGEQLRLDVRLQRHRLGLQGLPRRIRARRRRHVPRRCRPGRTRSRSRRRS